ncbi:MAG: hypothetical protein NT083_00135 [Rhodocyclales bacterium]|nr:hypothetical protein [Rhodocyclales bacterium]
MVENQWIQLLSKLITIPLMWQLRNAQKSLALQQSLCETFIDLMPADAVSTMFRSVCV